MAAVSRDARRRGASSPGEKAAGGLFSDFGRDSRTPRDVHDDLVDVVGDERRRLLGLGVDVLVEFLDHIRKDLVLCGTDRRNIASRRVDSRVLMKTPSTRSGIASTPSPRPRHVEAHFSRRVSTGAAP